MTTRPTHSPTDDGLPDAAPTPQRRLVVEAHLFLGFAKLLVFGLPFRLLAPLLGRKGSSLELRPTSHQCATASRVRVAVLHAAVGAPWGYDCLPVTLASRWMMALRRVPCNVFLGVRKLGESELAAHAWLSVGDDHHLGEPVAGEYKPIAVYRSTRGLTPAPDA